MADGVSHWLQSQYGVFCSREWLEACISWLQQRSQSIRLHDGVYSQWLHTDLRESCDSNVHNGRIPPHVFHTEAGEIQERLIVQIDSVINVGVSSYSQLQKIKGLEIDDDTPTGNRGPQNQTSKSNRMLFLTLTDGCGLIHAMEYQPIGQLSVDTPPGTKLKLEGLIKYRLGVMLLVEGHVTVLGGAVDELIKENSEKNVLLKNLNIVDNQETNKAPPTNDNTPSVTREAPPTNNIPINNPSYASTPRNIQSANVGVVRPQQPIHTANDSSVICLDTPPRPAPPTQYNDNHIEYIDLLSQSHDNEGAGHNEQALYTSFNDDKLLDDTDWDEFYDFDDFSTAGSQRVNNKDTPIPVNQVFQAIVGNPSIKVYCKASVSQLEDDLRKDATDWSIGAVITDNTGDLPVTIGNDPIQTLIGFTLAEYKAKAVPTVQMRQGLIKCHRTISSLNCVMELQWAHGNVTVTKFIN